MIATKFGNKLQPNGPMVVDGSAKYVHEACEASLKRLQIDYIDLYYQHRIDRKVGIETTVTEMKVRAAYGSSAMKLYVSTLHLYHVT